jgi:hypothetical protein
MTRNQKSKYVSNCHRIKEWLLRTDANDPPVSFRQLEKRGNETDDLDHGSGYRHEHHRPLDASFVRALQGTISRC